MYVSKNGDSRKTPKNVPNTLGKLGSSQQTCAPSPSNDTTPTCPCRWRQWSERSRASKLTRKKTARLFGDALEPLFLSNIKHPILYNSCDYLLWYHYIMLWFYIYLITYRYDITKLLLSNNKCDYFDLIFPLVSHDMSSHLCMLAAWPPFLWDSQKTRSYHI